jgi:16S rRNA (uracil1498-N3)-methyltransferase
VADERVEAVPADGGPLAFVDDLGAPVLSDDDHHHLSRVRRLRDGDPLVIADGRGRWAPARFAGRQPDPTDDVRTAPRSRPEVGVGFALVKGAKPELVVQKLVELGVDRIRPFVAARSIVRWDDAKAAAAHRRWERVAMEAAAQCRRAWPATVEEVTAYADVAALAGACRADRDGGPLTLDRPLVLVGPEGGWDEAERAADIPVVGLGPNVLRAETAAITAGALLGALRAGLVGPA